jgi:hypothetical protein
MKDDLAIHAGIPDQSAPPTSASVPIVLEKPTDPHVLCGEQELNDNRYRSPRRTRHEMNHHLESTKQFFSNLTSTDKKSNLYCCRKLNYAGYAVIPGRLRLTRQPSCIQFFSSMSQLSSDGHPTADWSVSGSWQSEDSSPPPEEPLRL